MENNKEERNNKIKKYVIGGVVVLASLAAGYTLATNRKLNRTIKSMSDAIDKASKDIHVVVPDYIVNQAVEKAVDREVANSITREAKRATDNINKDIYKKVSDAVSENYSKIASSVSKELERQVSYLDIDRIKKEVAEAAKEEAISKFNGELEDVLRNFNSNLESVSKIYSSIAATMTPQTNNDKVVQFKL